MTEIDMEIKIQVECEGNYVPSVPSHFDHNLGAWLPEDGGVVDDFKVFIVKISKLPAWEQSVGNTTRRTKLDITDWLSEEEYDELYESYLEAMEDES